MAKDGSLCCWSHHKTQNQTFPAVQNATLAITVFIYPFICFLNFIALLLIVSVNPLRRPQPSSEAPTLLGGPTHRNLNNILTFTT